MIPPVPKLRRRNSEFLTPIMVRCLWGRVGSTLLMQLLGTSDAIAFNRAYPCEDRVLSSLLHLAQPIAGPPPTPAGWWMDDPDRLWWMDPAWLGAVQSAHDPLPGLDAPWRDVLHRRVVRALWSAYTQTEREYRGPGVRYYAEKYGAYAEVLASSGIPVLFIDLIREPRDIWLSVRAFDRKRDSYGFGRREGQSEEDYLRSFLRSIRRRLDVMAAAEGDVNVRQVRYEQLVGDLDAQANRLSQWLGVPLQPAAVREAEDRFRHHMTSASVPGSVERWRAELSIAELSVFQEVLGHHLVRLGYQAGHRMVVAEP
jgi:sulfotransferase family protein